MPQNVMFSGLLRASTLAIVGSMFAIAPASAHVTKSDHDHTVVEVAQDGRIFSEEERRIIADVFDLATGKAQTENDDVGNGKDKNGKAGKGAKGKGNNGVGNNGLPPGIAMKLERGGQLPPGIAKRDLPADVQARLPKRNDGTIRQVVGDDVVLIEKGTEIILDVIRNVVRN